MKTCGRIIAGITLLLFIVSAVIAIFVVHARIYLLSPETYSKALNRAEVYRELPALVSEQLIYGMSFNPCEEDPDLCEREGQADPSESQVGGLPDYFARLPGEIWEGVFTALLDPLWLEAQTVDVLSQVFSIFTTDSPPQSIVISMGDLSERFSGEAGYEAVLEVVEAQPDCTAEQVVELSQGLITEGLTDAIVRCNPPADVLATAEPFIRSGLAEVVRTLPPTIELELPEELLRPEGSAAIGLRLVRGILQYTYWVALFWLLVVTLFAVRDMRSWLGWWGTSFLFVGLGTLALGWGSGPMFDWGVDRALEMQTLNAFSPRLVETARQIVFEISNGFSMRLLISGGILTGAGVLMLIIRSFTQGDSKGQIGQSLTQPRLDS